MVVLMEYVPAEGLYFTRSPTLYLSLRASGRHTTNLQDYFAATD